MLNFRTNMTYHREIQQPTNKNTVKKQFLHPLIRFNSLNDKENQHLRSNLIQNLTAKDTVRKQNETLDEEIPTQYCSNHPERKAEFTVEIEQGVLAYCKKCATQVASQGFDVHRIVTSPIQNLTQPFRSSTSTLNLSTEQILLPNISPTRRRPSLTNRTSHTVSQKRSQLNNLSTDLRQLKSQYHQKSSQLYDICQTFNTQKQTLNEYYSELIAYIEQIRDSHIQAIEETSVNVVQVCEIQNGEISQTVGQIDQMLDDIQSNFDLILNRVDEQNYAECFNFYKQKAGLFSHRLQELGSEANSWPCTSQQQILTKVRSFKSFVNQLHEVHDEEDSF